MQYSHLVFNSSVVPVVLFIYLSKQVPVYLSVSRIFLIDPSWKKRILALGPSLELRIFTKTVKKVYYYPVRYPY
jgi:hypothetical protein